eukprot:3515944-Rhodomonas_salina.2
MGDHSSPSFRRHCVRIRTLLPPHHVLIRPHVPRPPLTCSPDRTSPHHAGTIRPHVPRLQTPHPTPQTPELTASRLSATREHALDERKPHPSTDAPSPTTSSYHLSVPSSLSSSIPTCTVTRPSCSWI